VSKTLSRKECERQKMKRILERMFADGREPMGLSRSPRECLRFGKTKEGIL
jgi:hypothetical protein